MHYARINDVFFGKKVQVAGYCDSSFEVGRLRVGALEGTTKPPSRVAVEGTPNICLSASWKIQQIRTE